MEFSISVHFQGDGISDLLTQTKWGTCEFIDVSSRESMTREQLVKELMGKQIELREVYKAHPGVLRGRISQDDDDGNILFHVTGTQLARVKGDVLKIAHMEGVSIES